MNRPTVESLAQRVRQLEKQNKFWRLLGIVLLAGFIVLVLIAQVTPKSVLKVIEANEFVLCDSTGNTRATLTAKDGFVGLSLLDEYGDPHAGFFVGDKGDAELILLAEEGRGGLKLRTEQLAGSSIGFYNSRGELGVFLSLISHLKTEEQSSVLMFSGPGGMSAPVRVTLKADHTSSSLVLNDPEGYVLWKAP